MPKGDNLQMEHSFGKSYRQHTDNNKLKCHECGRTKKNSELNTDGYKYICNSCKGDES